MKMFDSKEFLMNKIPRKLEIVYCKIKDSGNFSGERNI